MADRARFRMDVGRLLIGEVRDRLNEYKLLGYNFDFYEGRGWISRAFTVVGEENDVARIYRELLNALPSIEDETPTDP